MTYKTQLKKRVLAGLLAGTALWLGMPAALAASGAVPNTQLPQGGSVIAGSVTLPDFVTPGHSAGNNSSVTIVQNSQNAVIQWGGQVNGVQVDGGFNVGANATVNFEGPANGYNTLNYDASGNMSQIYGAINANNKGNIYIVNPAGVEISSSAQINVGSLYVSNKKMETKDFTDFQSHAGEADFVIDGTTTDAALMSLGNINAANVTFDGGRIVIDTERLKNGDDKMEAGSIHVRTTDAGQVVLGYNGYDESSNTYGETTEASALASVTDKNGKEITDLKGYMWVEDIKQLQAVNTNLSGQYALRNSIDATATKAWADGGFKPIIGKDDGNDIAFTGKFDGLDYNIFNLNINRNTENNVGLFGVVGGTAVIQNVTLVGGSIKGQNNVGALAGQVSGGAQISNIMNSASVTGSSDVGGIIGSAGKSDFKNLVNTGTVAGTAEDAANNAGGLIGSLTGGTLFGTSYNLGGVTGNGYNVGGLVGYASDATLGGEDDFIYNRLNVSGAYNVGGIVGSMTDTTVQNAENSGNVTAKGYTTGEYTYHTAHYAGGTKQEDVYIANAGGIAGKSDSTEGQNSEIKNVQNSGDVSSGTASGTEDGNQYTYYTAGNVGGIVGSAVDTDISNATNEENDIRGAHNVGGIAGYFSGKGTITTGINSGGDILATGARNSGGFVKEWVRAGGTGDENTIIGNMGGIAGYMNGDDVYIVSSANRGTVHSQDIIGNTVLEVSEAANVGGIVGKIDRSDTLSKNELGTNYEKAAVSNSYNTGDVRGYMGVGGVAGMMYNGEIAGSYNLGTVNTTRNKDSFGSNDSYYTVNMGGIVGDTTEGTRASAVLYDVYNKGQIGDETFTYYARHVGGIVGRLSGTVEKAYNTGAIYNGYNVVGGIAGWMFTGSITNSFNTGNITVVNNERDHASSQVGGIVGAASTNNSNTITNVYNLGTLRSFTGTGDGVKPGANTVGGIIGIINGNGSHQVSVTNAYTTGNIWADNGYSSYVGSIWGNSEVSEKGTYRDVAVKNTYYIQPDPDLIDENRNPYFTTLDKNGGNKKDNSNAAIAYADRHKKDVWNFSTTGADDKGFSSQTGGDVTIDSGQDWRIYDGNSLPILNAFLPNTEKYFSDKTDGKEPMKGIASIQYGTAYDPLLTIIDAGKNTQNLTFDWQKLGVNNAAGIAVYGAGLTLDNFKATGGSGYFGGMIYSDGALSIESASGGDVALGSASQLYGSSVSISSDGNVTIYGDVTATGNTQDGTTRNVDENGNVTYKDLKDFTTSGDISITGGSVDVYGQLTSAKEGKTTFVPGSNNMAEGWTPGTVSEPTKPMTDIGDRFGYTTGASAATGSISITATASEDGHVNVYYGHQQKGFLDTAGSLTVSGSGDVYMDSDLSIGGNLSITSPGEMILDISNIGKVQKDNGTVPDSLIGLHTFLHHFDKNDGTDKGTISFTGTEGKAADAKITIDMWDDEKNKFDLTKYDSTDHELVNELDNLNFSVSGADNVTAKDYTYIWVSTGEQLAGIQQAVKENSSFLGYNFALKNDIDASASAVEKYEAIGTGFTNGFTGTFDGRDHRIIGLNVTGGNAGIFDTIGADGKVEDLRVYSGIFNGTDNAGAVAGINNGTISNVTTFGNVVTAKGSSNSKEMSGDTADTTVKVGAAGGIAGVNAGTIDKASASDAVTADDGLNNTSILSTAGGIAGINQNKISNSSSDSAVNASAGSTYALGGIAGVNAGTLSNVDSLGVTTGIYEVGSHNTAIGTQYSDNVGGIAGRNSGTVSEAYNESIVSGRDNVGGILGVNTGESVTDVSNAARVTGEAASNDTSDYVGGLVGSNSGSITNGRNNGEITGNQYVGGLVGENGKNSTLSNLVNDEAASITGDNYVGGIAGRNYGTISANDKGLVNRGSIIGQMYVGGVAGSNEDDGIITNTISSIALHVKTPYISGQDESTAPKYFGGVVGQNSGTINGATNESSVDVAADGATMVGGIIGQNTSTGTLEGNIANKGLVSGKSNVGGIIGSNENQNILNNADKDENGQPNERLVVSNSGRVQAEDGGAAGIFYENTGAINNADLTNTGMVIGGSSADSVTGGLFGTNSRNITNSTLTNNGTVYGGGTVGGLIGKNTGDISTSSLINSVDGKVIGLNNVGGLIGQNYGIITGGRTEKNEQGKNTDVGYYKYQIYNNGTIQVGKWNDSDQDGKIADGEITTDSVSGSNIGGLVGLNGSTVVNGVPKTGSITAAYNTGAIMAGSSTNVGGIAGTNTGTLNQVFNTVMTADGQNQTITGGTNVGGIVGSNKAGTVSNAYNTSDINGGTDTVGGIAGNNAGEISTVFTTQENLIANNSENGAVDKGFVLSADTAKNSESYTGFGLTGNGFSKESSDGIWKIYDGSSMALLKVFLTKAKVADPNLVYNGQKQVIGTNSIEAVYGDVTIPPLGQNSHKDAGNYDDWLYSSQIAASGTEADGTFNPNHLGYDIVYTNGNVGIKKAVITVTGNRVDRTYGSKDIDSSTDGTGVFIGGNKDYGFTVTAENTDITDEMKAELTGSNLGFNTNEISDGALNTESGKTTNDVKDGGYTWNTDLTLSGTLKNNYTFGNGSNIDGDKTTVTGNSYVNKATITVDLIDVNRTYGNAAINKTDTNDKGSYGYTFGEGDIVNNDTVDSLKAEINAITGGYHNRGEGVAPKETNDAGTYELTFENNLVEMGSTLQNYNIISVKNGTATVNKAVIEVSADDHQIYVGAPEPTYTGTKIEDLLVNGDSLNGTSYEYGPQDPVDTSQTGEPVKIGIHFTDGSYYAAGGDWNSAWDGFKNYEITFKPGTLTIKDLPAGMPDISDSERWNSLLRDTPWDRNENFRERKAEVHFLAGGMTL